MNRKCSVINCSNTSAGRTLFSFPNLSIQSTDPKQFERCLKWIKATGNASLLKKDPTYLHKHFYICSDHFHDEDFAGATKKRLKAYSCPRKLTQDFLPSEKLQEYLLSVCNLFPLNCTVKCFDVSVNKLTENNNQQRHVIALDYDCDSEQNHVITIENESGSEFNVSLKTPKLIKKLNENCQKEVCRASTENASKVASKRFAEKSFEGQVCSDKNSFQLPTKRIKVMSNVLNNDFVNYIDDVPINDNAPQETGSFVRRKCSAQNCFNTNLSSNLHSFPGIYSQLHGLKQIDYLKLKRCREWVLKSGNKSLLQKNPSHLQNNNFLCNAHFPPTQFMAKHSTTLKRNAIPSLFDCKCIDDGDMQVYDTSWNISQIEIVKMSSDVCADTTAIGVTQAECNNTVISASSTDNITSNENHTVKQATIPSGHSNLPERQTEKTLDASQSCIPNIQNEESDISPCKDIQMNFHKNSHEHVLENNIQNPQKNKRKRKECSAKSCLNTNIQCSMFQFPKVLSVLNGHLSLNGDQLQRFTDWVRATGNRQLILFDPDTISKKYYLCSDHFHENSFVNPMRNRLKSDAIPTMFTSPPLSLELMDTYNSNILLWQENSFSETSFKSDETFAFSFEKEIDKLKWIKCDTCKEKFLSSSDSQSCLHFKNCWQYSHINNMDPGIVPKELQGMTFIEEQLIARVHPIISVFKLNGLQYGYKENVINFYQDVKEFAKVLPYKIRDISSVINVRYKNNNDKFHDFHVRCHIIRTALIWLKNNNPFYEDIIISEDNLQELPVNGNVFDQLHSLDLEPKNPVHSGRKISHDIEEIADFQSDSDSFDSSDTEEDNEDDFIHHSCVAQGFFPHQDSQVKATLNWPTQGIEPIDEFHTVGYIACAFPTLFPSGTADFRDFRTKEIHTSNYFKHLLRFHDNRFAQHRTFRFFAYNSWMRWTALTDGNIFIKNNPEYRNMTAQTLKDKINENPNILKKIMFQSSNLRGTKAFWHTRANELKDMVNQLGLPTIFLTLSCADFHWNALYKLLADKDDISDLTEKERRKLLQDNPHIVDMFFDFRIRAFIKQVMIEKYNVVDYWYRIEYQHRGSPHLHGLFWIAGAPDLSDLPNESPEKIDEALNYFSKLITAVNPRPHCCDPNTHPCRLSFDNIEDFEEDLGQLLHKVQRHTKCSTKYCLKFNKKTKATQCRFKFPIEMQEEATLEKSETGELEFKPARNDPLLNKFNSFVIQLWRANIDIAPVISKEALLSYLAKYISKSEISSEAFDEIIMNIIEKLNDNEYAKKAIQKLFMRSCAERDISSQEVCHTMLSLKLYSAGGRKFVVLNFACKNWIQVKGDECENEYETHGQNFIEKYIDRPNNLEDLSLWKAATSYNVPKWKKATRDSIVRIFPRLHLQLDNENSNEPYYEQQVLLHIPWRNKDDLKVDNISWKEIFIQNELENIHPDTILRNNRQETEEDLSSVSNFSESEGEEEWMLLSRLGPNTHLSTIELGSREEDVNFDWSNNYQKYEQYGTLPEFQCFIDKEKGKEHPNIDVIDMPQITFSDDQLTIVQLMDKQINDIQSENKTCMTKRVIVQGKAGTGKSLLIKYLRQQLNVKLGQISYILATPTGVSAILINGKTLHSIFHIPKRAKDFQPLTGERARKLCNLFQHVKFLLLDEFSMIGCNNLAFIDLRCKEATGNHDEAFGGLNVYLFGDIKQLPPVKDSPLYSNNQKSVNSKHGKAIINDFQKIFILRTCHRQQDEDFVNVLDNLSDGKMSKEDYVFLSSRFKTNVTSQEQEAFANAIRLFSTKQEVKDYNMKKLGELKDPDTQAPLPVARIPAKHNCQTAKKGTSEDAEGLETVVYFSKGCKIMLRSNLWVANGLVNGAIGTVVDILYDINSQPPNGQPSVILCQFDTYTGPGIIPNTKIIPIKPILKSWTATNGDNCTRYQFPISLCYACSIHKSQGLTLDMAVVNIGEKEFALGLSYVALSRVRSLEKLLLYPFTFQRLCKLRHNQAIQNRTDFLNDLTLMRSVM